MFKNIIAKEFLMTKKDVNGIIIKLEKNVYFMCLFEEGNICTERNIGRLYMYQNINSNYIWAVRL